MDLTKYQEFTRTTAIYPKERALDYLVLGLASEAGEVAGKWKKNIRDGVFVKDDFIAELGDCFWYLTRIADELGITIDTVVKDNYLKLYDRQKRHTLQGNGDNR